MNILQTFLNPSVRVNSIVNKQNQSRERMRIQRHSSLNSLRLCPDTAPNFNII